MAVNPDGVAEQVVGGADYFSTHEDVDAYCMVVEQLIENFGIDIP